MGTTHKIIPRAKNMVVINTEMYDHHCKTHVIMVTRRAIMEISINRVGRLETMYNKTGVKIIVNEPNQRKEKHKPKWLKTPPKNGVTSAEDEHTVPSFTLPRSTIMIKRRILIYILKQLTATKTNTRR